MEERLSKTLLCICAVLVLLTTGCGANYMVKGQVVDAQNGHPIEGAAIVINWYGRSIESYIIPYDGSGAYTLEIAEVLTDENGAFQIPKYIFKHFDMGVYKKGYVCWNNQSILLKKTEKSYLGTDIKLRKGFRIKNGMKIKLEVLTNEYSRNRHAHFTSAVAGSCEAPYINGIFREATRSETLLHRKLLRGE